MPQVSLTVELCLVSPLAFCLAAVPLETAYTYVQAQGLFVGLT